MFMDSAAVVPASLEMEGKRWTATASTIHPRREETTDFTPTVISEGVPSIVELTLLPLLAVLQMFGMPTHVVHATRDPHWNWGFDIRLFRGTRRAFAKADAAWSKLCRGAGAPLHALDWLREHYANNYGGVHFDGTSPVIVTKPRWAAPTHPKQGDGISDAEPCSCSNCVSCAPMLQLLYFPDVRLLFPADSVEMVSLSPLITALDGGPQGAG